MLVNLVYTSINRPMNSEDDKPLSESFTAAELFLAGFSLGVMVTVVAVGVFLKILQHS